MMKDDDDKGSVFEIIEEDGLYLENLKKYLFNDNYPKPNRCEHNNNCNDKYKKIKEVKSRQEKLLNPIMPKIEKRKNIHAGHRKRLRETFNNVDPLVMPDHQILELMLSYVQPQKDVNPLAHKLLEEYGSISNVLDANPDDLKKINGIGEVLSSYIHFCSKLPAIYNNSKINYKAKINTPAEIVDYLRTKVTYGAEEEFYYLCLNNNGEVLTFKSMGTGNPSKLYVDTRNLTSQVLKYPTNSVIICHTHTSGLPKPSLDDKKFTLQLYNLFEHLHIRLADHIIISPEGYFSFFQSGTQIGNKTETTEQEFTLSFPYTPKNDNKN